METGSMRSVFKLENLCYFFLILVCISIPLSIRLNTKLIIITFCFTVYHFIFKSDRKLRNAKYLWVFVVLYFMHFIGLANSQNLKPAFFDLEQKLPILAIPLLIVLGPELSTKKVFILLGSFISVLFIVCILSFRNGFFIGYVNDDLYDSLLVHRPYLGMYCVFAIVCCVELFRLHTDRRVRYFSLFMTVFFIGFLLVLLAKMAIVTLMLLVAFYIIILLFRKKSYRGLIIILFSGVVAFVYFFLINERGQEIGKKLLSFSSFDWGSYDPVLVNSLNLRFIKWSCSAEVLTNDHHWLVGAGTGDTKPLLDLCYAGKAGGDSFLVKENYNSHNSYLTVWLHLGLFPFLFFVFHFIIVLRRQIREHNLIPLFFTLSVIILGMTESIFEVQKGLVFYAFFQSIFLLTRSGLDKDMARAACNQLSESKNKTNRGDL